MTTLVDTADIRRIARDEVAALARTAYERYLDQLRTLSVKDWARPTECPDWDVREMAVHVLGACRGCASLREQVHQVRAGRRWAAAHDRPEIDGINAVQIADRQHLTPDDVVTSLAAAIEPAVRGRQRVPGLLRRMEIGDGSGGPLLLGRLMDVIYTRDTWMHRVDTALATDRMRDLVLTPDHDGRIVADAVAEWAEAHQRPFRLELSGPAGGAFRHGTRGATIHMDAVEFLCVLSGREREAPPESPDGEELLQHRLLF